jgi:hypothetical protein
LALSLSRDYFTSIFHPGANVLTAPTSQDILHTAYIKYQKRVLDARYTRIAGSVIGSNLMMRIDPIAASFDGYSASRNRFSHPFGARLVLLEGEFNA